MQGTLKGLRLGPILIAAAMLFPGASVAGESFNGLWNTTLNCTPFQDAQGFTWQFVSEIRDGHLLGRFGIEGQPASIRIEGQVAEDGTGTLHASGRTGMSQYAVGNLQRGSNISYDIRVEFHEGHGKGTRLEGRPCTYIFERQ